MMQWIPDLYKYRHISFDLWMTLIKSDPEFKKKRDLLFREYFSVDKSAEEVSAVIRKYDLLTNTINEKVGRNFDTFEIYYLIIDALSVDIEKFSITQLYEFYSHTEDLLMQHKPVLLNDDIPSVLHQLRDSGKTMNILSNTAFIKGSTLRKLLGHYNLERFFSFQIYSDETGFSKPNHKIFEQAYQQKLSEDPEVQKKEILHVGDNIIADYNGALDFGFDAFLLKI